MSMKHMFIVLLLMVGTYTFAQDVQQSNAVGNEPLLQQNEELNKSAQAVNDAQQEVLASTTGSRSVGEAAKAKLKAACLAYEAALLLELANSNNGETTAAINREIEAVKKLVPEENKSTR